MAGAVARALRKRSAIAPDALIEANDQAIGQILVARGSLKEEDLAEISDYARHNALPIGEAAVARNLISQQDLDQALAHQFRFPYLQPGKCKLSKELITAYKPFSRKAEMFRYARAQLMLGSLEKERKILAIVSPAKKDGRSYVAANLAVVFAQLGKKTLLMDCHLQKPRQQEIFQVGRKSGISSLLSARGDNGIEPEVISDLANLSVLNAGPCPPNPDELIAGDSFGRLCQRMRRDYEVILVDTPPGNTSTSVDWIAARCNSVVIVYRRHKTGLAEARDFSQRMRARASIAGAILNKH